MKERKTQKYYKKMLSRLQAHYLADDFSVASQRDTTARLNTIAQLLFHRVRHLSIRQFCGFLGLTRLLFLKQALTGYLKSKTQEEVKEALYLKKPESNPS